MERITLNSSTIESAGYNGDQQLLEIEFKSGSVYQYFDVPESVSTGFFNASSHGKYFNDYIRNVYTTSKVR